MGKGSHTYNLGNFIRKKKTGYINNCSIGFRSLIKNEDKARAGVEAEAKLIEVHHLICESSLKDDSILVHVNSRENLRKILDKLEAETWEIDNSSNLIGLPMKRVFYRERTIELLRAAEAESPLPCHDVQHNRYIEDVDEYLANSLWRCLNAPCDVPESWIPMMLDAISADLLALLQARGMREGGLIKMWESRHSNPETWFIPFSMAGDCTWRKAPPVPEASMQWEEYRKKYWDSL
jgi:hypothetical protein